MSRLAALGMVFVAALLPVALAPAAEGRAYSGTLEIRHSDDFAHARTQTSYRLLHGGHSTPLVLARAPRTPSGSTVVVDGRRRGSRIRGVVRPRGLVHAATVPAGPRTTAVILISFAGDTRPWTPDQVRTSVFTGAGSANAFYADDSYGDVSLVGSRRSDGDVFGWYTIAGPVGTCSTTHDVDVWAQQAQSAAAADGFNAANYDHVIYAFPPQAACSWSGLGELPGSQSWINGDLSTRVVAHELGHNMGLHHASSLRCTAPDGSAVSYSSTCTTSEYGDPFDVMGGGLRRNNAWHLQQIGFLRAANVQIASASGTYTIKSALTRVSGTQLLRVPIGGTTPRLYYDLDLRSSGGAFDNFASNDPAVQGVVIHVDPDVSNVTQSLLVDATPSTSSLADAPLAAGRSFSDGKVLISVRSVSGGTAIVDVGVPPPDTTPPSAPPGLTATPASDRVTLAWSAASDDVGVSGYRVYRDGIMIGTTSATDWTDTQVSPGVTYTYGVVAYDAAGNSSTAATASATVPQPVPTVAPPPPTSGNPPPPTEQPPGGGSTILPPGDPPLPPPPDTVRPNVRIVSPARGSHVRRRAVVRAVASDAGGVVRTEVWVDGVRRRSVHSASVTWTWPLRTARRGRHTIVVRSFDTSGNGGSARVRVRVTA